jgi:hypothetical protein
MVKPEGALLTTLRSSDPRSLPFRLLPWIAPAYFVLSSFNVAQDKPCAHPDTELQSFFEFRFVRAGPVPLELHISGQT